MESSESLVLESASSVLSLSSSSSSLVSCYPLHHPQKRISSKLPPRLHLASPTLTLRARSDERPARTGSNHRSIHHSRLCTSDDVENDMAREITSMGPRHLFGGAITMDLPVLYGDARWVTGIRTCGGYGAAGVLSCLCIIASGVTPAHLRENLVNQTGLTAVTCARSQTTKRSSSRPTATPRSSSRCLRSSRRAWPARTFGKPPSESYCFRVMGTPRQTFVWVFFNYRSMP